MHVRTSKVAAGGSVTGSKVVIAAVAVAVVGGSGIAYAFWSAGGSGSGTGATGTTVAIVAQQTSTVSDMRPGDSPQTLSGNFDNPNSGPVYVTSVTASIGGVTKAGGAAAGPCTAADYTLASPVMSVAAQVPAGSGQGSWSGATIKFNNSTSLNQDACKGATVSLSYSVS